ncbi:BRISC and BRCA1-A complex member 1 [Parasteatoda tepidariorum]|nr:BRISC and BRCA1-A complex member 1 [Parasteatoda tepidariorum]
MSSAKEDGMINLNSFGDVETAVKTNIKEEELEISPELFALKCSVSVPDDKNGKVESDKIELNKPSAKSAESKSTCNNSPVNTVQPELKNTASDSQSGSSSKQNVNSSSKYAHLPVPKINCAEKIIFCLDMSSDMEQTPFRLGDGSQHSPLSMVKRTIELFIENKHFISRKHEYSLMVLYENATWVREFTNDPKEVIESLEDLSETQPCSSCDLASIVTLITGKYEMTLPKKISLLPCIFRVILIYGRSSCMIHFSDEEAKEFLVNYPFIYLDIIYIHEPPTDDNKCQEIFEALCDLDAQNKSYIFEVTRNTTKLHNCMAKLLAHPMQRCTQKDASYRIRCPASEVAE